MKNRYLLRKHLLTAFAVLLSSITYSQTVSQTFSTPGAATFTVPPGVTSITVEAWGGGGKGGARVNSTIAPAGGGGGGAYSRSQITVIPNTSYPMIVGLGSSSELPGGDSSFNSGVVLAKGGQSVVANGSNGAAGGDSAIGVGTVKYSGGLGANAVGGLFPSGGGGGSSAGTAANGAASTGQTGGVAPAGGGNGSNGAYTGNALNGSLPGGGGGGGFRLANALYAPGNGGNGQIRISYVPPYRAQFTATNFGSTTWCVGETRNVTVTVTNTGAATWTNSNPDINIGVKWNAEPDYAVRVDANNLAPGQSATYTLSVTPPPGSTTNNLTFDVVNEGACWFGNNNLPCGPGNSIYTSPAISTNCVTNAPGGITADLQLWLRADLLNGTTSTADNANVSNWQTQALGSNAVVVNAGQEPKYRNEPINNVNFNPVVVFANSPIVSDIPGTATPQQYLRGASGYNSQEMFVVTIPDSDLSSATPSMAVFTGDYTPNVDGDFDISGIGLGNYTVRLDNEIISYVISSTPNDPATLPANRGFGVALTGTASYPARNVGIINARNNLAASPTTQELFYNANSIVNSTVGQSKFANFASRYWLGRNQEFKASFSGRIAEVITYSTRKDNTTQRNRIETYLALKYGITLGVNGTSQNYVSSDGTVIWNISPTGYNTNIAGIGRDDISKLNQKQSRSSNSADEVAIGLGEVAATNTANASAFTANKQFLVWGSNNAPIQAGSSSTVTLGPGFSSTFSIAQRRYKIVETGGDVTPTVVSLPKNALTSFAKAANQDYVLIVSSGPNFSASEIIDIVPMTETTANFETSYDFDGTRYFSFGITNATDAKGRVNNQTGSYFVGSRNINLSNSFTVSAWIRTTSGGTIISKSGAYQFYVNAANKVVGNWNGADRITSATSVNDGKWHNIAIILNAGTATLLIDGVVDTTLSVATLPNTNTAYFVAGGVWVNKALSSTFIGDIDELKIWNSALTVNQIRYVMNQEMEKIGTNSNGKILPFTVTKNDVSTIPWANLAAYYDFNTITGTSIKDRSDNNRSLRVKYLTVDKNTIDVQTAPLPYLSLANGLWQNASSWTNGALQTLPNDVSIVNGTSIDWNIVQIKNNIESQGRRFLLGALIDQNTLSATNNSSITISHYLKLNGKIDLVGRSQLIQTLNSDLDATSSGILERDQQGTSNKFDYNYWSSPVNTQNATVNNGTYTVNSVLKDGTTATPQNITWTNSQNGLPTTPITLSRYWIYKFQSNIDDYSNWIQVGENGALNPAQGFTLKGSGTAGTTNYTFVGKPNNGRIQFTMAPTLINLTGNPYTSALDAHQFINDNLATTTGTLYFWDHFGGNTHVYANYKGGYATLNLTGGVAAESHPTLENVGSGTKIPKRYVPVGQGFFVHSNASGGNVFFNNNQRAFVKEDDATSNPLIRQSNLAIPAADYFTNNQDDAADDTDEFIRIRVGIDSRDASHKQLLLGFMNENATSEIDPGYDALKIATKPNDMYFLHGESKLTIQGDGYFNENNTYPIGVMCDAEGLVKFMIDDTENLDAAQNIYLFDAVTETYHSIRNEVFEISLPAGTTSNRFILTFKTDESLSTIEHELDGIEVVFSNSDSILHIKNGLTDTTVTTATVFNILGQKLATYSTENQPQESIEIPISNVSASTYIIRIETTKGALSKKIILK